jgi:uncharacterized membrane protein AbrB (regulator of aidB expression)
VTGTRQNEILWIKALFSMKVLQTLSTFLIAAAGGLLFYLLNIPLPWMLGPLTAAIIYNTVSGRIHR